MAFTGSQCTTIRLKSLFWRIKNTTKQNPLDVYGYIVCGRPVRQNTRKALQILDLRGFLFLKIAAGKRHDKTAQMTLP